MFQTNTLDIRIYQLEKVTTWDMTDDRITTADVMPAKAGSPTQAPAATANTGLGTRPRDWIHTFNQDDHIALGVPDRL